MKLERIIERLRASHRDALQTAGHQIGLELSRMEPERLSSLRASVALTPEGVDTFAAGYRAAIDDLLAGHLAASSANESLGTAVTVVQSKAAWPEVLNALAAGVERPAEISRRIGRDPAVVSRALAGLRNLDLADAQPLPPGGDQRARLHRLTSLGQKVFDAIPPGARERPVDREAVELAFDVVVELMTSRRITESELARIAETAGERAWGTVAIQTILTAGKSRGLFWEAQPGEYLAAELTAQHRLADELEQLFCELSSHAQTTAMRPRASRVVDGLKQRAPRGTRLGLRCSRLRPKWDNVFQIDDDFEAARTFDTKDTELALTPFQPEIVVYDSPVLLLRDLKRNDPALEVAKRAKHRYCVASSFAALPDSFEAIRVEA